MKSTNALGLLCACLLALSAAGCGSEPNKPQTLEEQKAMATGRAPTPEELRKAMSGLPKAPGGAPQAPPPGVAPP